MLPPQDPSYNDARWLPRLAAVAVCGALVLLLVSVAMPHARAWPTWGWPLLFAVEVLGFLALIHARRRRGEPSPRALVVPAATFAALTLLAVISALLHQRL